MVSEVVEVGCTVVNCSAFDGVHVKCSVGSVAAADDDVEDDDNDGSMCELVEVLQMS